MKVGLSILVSALVTIWAIMVYDALRKEPTPEPEAEPLRVAELVRLEQRIAALEARPEPDEGPRLTGTGDAALARRLDALERRLLALETVVAQKAPPPSPAPEPPTVETAPDPASTDQPPASEVERFRKLRTAAQREDRRQKLATWVDRSLAKAEIQLTKRQQEQVVEASLEFEKRRNEIWAEAKTRARESGLEGDWREVVTSTSATIQQEFTERVSKFLPWQDAEQISSALYPDRSK